MRHCLAILFCVSLVLPADAQKAAEDAAQIHVTTQPEKAIVTIDGKVRGETPRIVSGLTPGKHLVIVAKAGYREVRKTVMVEKGQRFPLEFRLQQDTGLVIIHSTSTEAQIEIGGIARGKTPLLLTDLPLGRHKVTFSASGFEPKIVELKLDDRTPQKLEVDLRSDSGTIILSTIPTGATVLLNGATRGQTPCTVTGIPSGTNRLKVELEGHRTFEQVVKIQPGEREKLSIKMDPVPAILKIHSEPAGAKVFVNNQYQGEATQAIIMKDLKPGTYRVRVQMKGYEMIARNVALTHGQTKSELFGLSRNSGILEITTAPPGVQVFVDGEDRGKTEPGEKDRISAPLQVDLLEVGRHNVQLTHPSCFRQEFEIEIKLNETTVKKIPMKRQFVPDMEIRTASEVIVGVYHGEDALGNHIIEPRPGIRRTVDKKDVRVMRPLKKEKKKASPSS